tara:strand:+ start:1202 stop:1390 length:189 start_codon:yes stop_codon:yes gene_type:complete
MNHPQDKTPIKTKTNYKEYDSFVLYFGFKADSLNTYEKKRVRDRYGAKAKKQMQWQKKQQAQ